MHKLKGYQRVLLFLLLVLFLTSLLSPWAAWVWNLTIEVNPEWRGYRYPFSRIFDRLFMILAIAMFFPFTRFLKIASAAQLGLSSLRRGYRDLFRGFSLALISFIALVLIMSLSDVFEPGLRLAFEDGLERSVKGLLTAVTVGFLEEIFFRGMIFRGLLDGWKPTAAFLVANVFYAAIHFIKPAQKNYSEGLDPWLGFYHLIHAFERFLDPVSLLPGLFGLFLLGIVLSYALLRTGSLYLSIGLHAGWVFAIKSIKVYGNYRRRDLGWIFGASDPKFISGFTTWIGIIGVGVIIHWLTRRQQKPLTETEI
ncbi:MAG: lysostaphin resistance A-like protein [Candidatus Binatia bacterium]